MKAPLIAIFFSVLSSVEGEHPQGHLQPLGSHQDPEGVIASTDVVPNAKDFFERNALPGEPLLLKGAAKKMHAYSRWTDDYLREKFGDEGIDVEEGKKENRSLATFHFKLQDFIRRYKDEDIYMVESLPPKMREEYALLRSLNCGGYTNVLQDAIVWFSSGGTKSVLHFDSVDNINCLFDGTKELVLINKSHYDKAHIDRLDGGFSSVDVDSVDMYNFPGLQTIPYYKVFMDAGDCLFIPAKWPHQVRSYGSRNLAVNIWWAHFTTFNHTDCEESPFKDEELLPLSLFEFHPSEAIRQGYLEALDGQQADLKKWIELVQAQPLVPGREPSLEILEKNFHQVDANKDGFVTPKEINNLNHSEIFSLLSGMTEEIDGEGEEIVDDLHRATVEENKQFHDDSAGVDPSEEQEDTKHTEL